jgi:hypothetical protein
MKKLLLLSALFIFSCSNDEGNPCVYEPTLTTQAATDITETSATLNGVISIVSENCEVPNNTEQGFVYSFEIQPTLEDTQVNVNGTNSSTTIEGLEANTTYYVRSFLTNTLGEFYGNEIDFTTEEEITGESEFKGLWSGDFTGEDNGTWTLTVQDTGIVVGSFTSKDYNEIYSFSGYVNGNGEITASITLENVAGNFSGNLNNGLSLGSYTVSNRSGDFQGRSSTDDESQIVNNWNYYSAEYDSGEILYYDNEIYCPELYMEFREDGTFTDYFYADYSNDPDPDCPQELMYGTFSVQDGYYEMLYDYGGNQDLSESDIYNLS